MNEKCDFQVFLLNYITINYVRSCIISLPHAGIFASKCGDHGSGG